MTTTTTTVSTPTYTNGQIAHTELVSSDVEATKTFMNTVFGWNYTEMPMPGGDGTYTMYSAGGVPFGGITAPEGDNTPGTLTFLSTDNINGAIENITSNGGTILKPVTSLGDQGSMAVFQVPGGPVLGLWQEGLN